MARSKKTKNLSQKATRLLTVVAGSVVMEKGLNYLSSMDFMQSEETVNVKQLSVNGGALIAGSVISFFAPNDSLEHLGYGIAAAGVSALTDNVIDMVSSSGEGDSVSGMGRTGEEIVNLFDTDDDLGDASDLSDEEEFESALSGEFEDMLV